MRVGVKVGVGVRWGWGGGGWVVGVGVGWVGCLGGGGCVWVAGNKATHA